MKLLMVSRSVLPFPGGSSVIVEQLAQNFAADELVVLGGAPYFSRTDWPRPATSPPFYYQRCEFNIMGRGYRYFKWLHRFEFKPLVRRICALAREHQVDQIVGVYPTELFCLAACRAAKQLGLPFSSYFHNTYVENTNISDPRAPAIQAEIFAASQKVLVMSKGMQRFYEEQYGLDKFVPLVHTFAEFPDPETLSGIPGQKDHYRLVAIGNFNESNREATARFLAAIKDDERFSLDVYTHVPELLLKQRGIDTSALTHRGSVAPEAIHGMLQQYDICVLTHGFTGGYGPVEYRTIFPTRTIPFLLSGKPIFAHSPAGSFLNDFIREHGCGLLVDEAATATIRRELARLAADEELQAALVAAAQRTAGLFHGPTVVAHFKALLSEVSV